MIYLVVVVSSLHRFIFRGSGSIMRERRTRGASPAACRGMLHEVGLEDGDSHHAALSHRGGG
jgi:hypothetical protein